MYRQRQHASSRTQEERLEEAIHSEGGGEGRFLGELPLSGDLQKELYGGRQNGEAEGILHGGV